jgi:hypothetical protein
LLKDTNAGLCPATAPGSTCPPADQAEFPLGPGSGAHGTTLYCTYPSESEATSTEYFCVYGGASFSSYARTMLTLTKTRRLVLLEHGGAHCRWKRRLLSVDRPVRCICVSPCLWRLDHGFFHPNDVHQPSGLVRSSDLTVFGTTPLYPAA